MPTKGHPKWILLLQLLLACVFSYYLLGANFTAQFGLIDDHEIISYLGSKDTLLFSEIIGKLKQTEAWIGNVTTRYRPSYYFLRLTETSIWGNSALCWYFARVFMLWVSMVIAWRLCMRPYGVVLGGIVTVTIFSNVYWADIFARLGPGETYCTFGLALYCLAFVELWESRESSRIKSYVWWLLLGIGSLVCMGSKENFLLLLPTTFLLCIRTYQRKTLTRVAVIVNVVIFSFGIFVTAVIASALNKTGVDVYQNPVSPQARINALFNAVGSNESLTLFSPFFSSIAFMLLIVILVRSKGYLNRDYDAIGETRRLVYAESCLAALFLSQLAFYNGIWPTGMRYDFPGMIGVVLANIILVYSVANILGNIYLAERWKRIAPLIITSVMCCIYFFGNGVEEAKNIKAAAYENSVKTTKFMAVFQALGAAAKREPSAPIVLESNSAWDSELVFSMRTYLKANGIGNPTVVVTNYTASKDISVLERHLAEKLTHFSRHGDGPNGYQDALYPAQIIEHSKRYFVVTFSGKSRLPGIFIGRAW